MKVQHCCGLSENMVQYITLMETVVFFLKTWCSTLH